MRIESKYQWIWQSKQGNKASDKEYKKDLQSTQACQA
jgi:hypothetical protein